MISASLSLYLLSFVESVARKIAGQHPYLANITPLAGVQADTRKSGLKSTHNSITLLKANIKVFSKLRKNRKDTDLEPEFKLRFTNAKAGILN